VIVVGPQRVAIHAQEILGINANGLEVVERKVDVGDEDGEVLIE